MSDGEADYTEAEKDDGAIRSVQKNLISVVLLGIAGLCALVLFVYGDFQNQDVQAIMIWVILILVMLSILILMREKLSMMLILYGVFAGAYLVEGYIIGASGMGDPFSWGVLTFGMISLFVYATGLQKNFTQKHIYIFVIFLITAWLLNAGGWMGMGNNMTTELLSRLAGEFKDVIMVVI